MSRDLISKHTNFRFYFHNPTTVWSSHDHMVHKVGYLANEFVQRFDAEYRERKRRHVEVLTMSVGLYWWRAMTCAFRRTLSVTVVGAVRKSLDVHVAIRFLRAGKCSSMKGYGGGQAESDFSNRAVCRMGVYSILSPASVAWSSLTSTMFRISRLSTLALAGRSKCRKLATAAAQLPSQSLGHLPTSQSPITPKLQFFNSVMEDGKQIPTYRVLDGTGKVIEGAQLPEVCFTELSTQC